MTDEARDPEDTRSVEETVEIEASPERVWRALTDASELERWFPLEARVEPGEGGSIWMSWKNEWAGGSEILAWDPPRHLKTSWEWHEGHGNAQITDYRLWGREGGTVLRVVTSGFPHDAAWDEWVEGTRRGWRFELASLRLYLERHEGRDRSVLYLRRRVPLSREEAWSRLRDGGALDPGSPHARVLVDEAPDQYAAELGQPPESLLRIANEPCHLEDREARDVSVWLSAWGGGAADLEAPRATWSRRLERIYPEGAFV